jgi:ParB-like chromosome segregation protein Spo0J
MTQRIRRIEITKIEPNCRCVYDFESIDDMIRSIRQNGQVQAIKAGGPAKNWAFVK